MGFRRQEKKISGNGGLLSEDEGCSTDAMKVVFGVGHLSRPLHPPQFSGTNKGLKLTSTDDGSRPSCPK